MTCVLSAQGALLALKILGLEHSLSSTQFPEEQEFCILGFPVTHIHSPGSSKPLPPGLRYLVEVLHELQVALLTDQQVQVLLPVSVHGLDVSLQHRSGRGMSVGPPWQGETWTALQQVPAAIPSEQLFAASGATQMLPGAT